jgi:hypothetical protein
MLFLANYEMKLAHLDAAIAKRLDWDVAAPETMKIVGEWVAHGSGEVVRGVLVFETSDPADIQSLILYYGTTVTFDVRPASDVPSAVERTRALLDARQA